MIPVMEDMAQKGWELKSFDRFTATFRAVPPRKRICWVDVFTGAENPENGDKNLREYKKKWEKRGMKCAAHYDFFYYFYNTVPEPDLPETGDAQAEFHLMQKNVWRKEWLSMLIIFCMMIISCVITIQMSLSRLYDFTGVASLVMFPITIIPFLFISLYEGKWFLQMRRIWKSGQPLPMPDLQEARKRYRIFYGFIALVLFISVLSIIADTIIKYPFPMKLGGMLLAIVIAAIAVLRVWQKKSTMRGQLVSFLFVCGLVIISIIGDLAFDAGFGNRLSLPDNTTALTFSDLQNVKEEPVAFEFNPTISPVVPVRYSYLEALPDGTKIISEYYETASNRVADFVYDKLAKAIGEKRVMTPLDNAVFGTEGFAVDSENAVLITWDNKILYAELKDESGSITGLYEAIKAKFINK